LFRPFLETTALDTCIMTVLEGGLPRLYYYLSRISDILRARNMS